MASVHPDKGVHAWADEPHLYLNKKFLKGFEHLAKLAECPNVMTKISALFMPVLGHHFHQQQQLASKAQLIELATPLIQHALKCFGTDRAMFASNFPMDRVSANLVDIIDAFSDIVQSYDEHAVKPVFYENAKRFYRL